jgi:hypothetical protein
MAFDFDFASELYWTSLNTQATGSGDAGVAKL